MEKKFLCILAISAIVAAMAFSEADACRRCNDNCCSGCQSGGYISVPAIPSVYPAHHNSYSPCQGCSAPCSGPSYLPRQYCGNCLRRKSIRLVDNCSCGCGC